MTIVIDALSTLFRVYGFLILVRVILSWVNPDPYRQPYQPIMRFLYRVTEPVLAPLRRAIPPIGGGVDISPAVALILLELARVLIVSLLQRI
jgi:YggT family protein